MTKLVFNSTVFDPLKLKDILFFKHKKLILLFELKIIVYLSLSCLLI